MIFISAGHHEKAQGATYGAFTEFYFTVKYAEKIIELLGDRCVRVPAGTLKQKVNFINHYIKENPDKKPYTAIEIHFNSAKMWRDQNANGVIDDGEMVHVGRGSETLYYPGSKTGKPLAEKIQDALGRVCQPDRGSKEGWYQMNPAKGPDFFLAKTHCRAVIVEPEFIDNIENIRLKSNLACHAIAEALLEDT